MVPAVGEPQRGSRRARSTRPCTHRAYTPPRAFLKRLTGPSRFAYAIARQVVQNHHQLAQRGLRLARRSVQRVVRREAPRVEPLGQPVPVAERWQQRGVHLACAFDRSLLFIAVGSPASPILIVAIGKRAPSCFAVSHCKLRCYGVCVQMEVSGSQIYLKRSNWPRLRKGGHICHILKSKSCRI